MARRPSISSSEDAEERCSSPCGRLLAMAADTRRERPRTARARRSRRPHGAKLSAPQPLESSGDHTPPREIRERNDRPRCEGRAACAARLDEQAGAESRRRRVGTPQGPTFGGSHTGIANTGPLMPATWALDIVWITRCLGASGDHTRGHVGGSHTAPVGGSHTESRGITHQAFR